MSFTLLLLALSALVPNRELAAMEPGLECFFRGLQQVTRDSTTRAYSGFVDYAQTGYQNYLRLNEKQRRLLTALDAHFTQLNIDLPRLRAEVRRARDLTTVEKDEIIRLLGLTETDSKAALEVYRKNLQYYFWSDHSQVHMAEILERSQSLRQNAPKEFLAYFDPVLKSPDWQEKIESAIRIHDSRMSANRLQHAELLLDWDSALFPTHWTDEQIALNSVLGMLHSKSTVPYAELAQWPKVVTEKMIPTLISKGQLSVAKAEILKKAIGKLSAAEISEMGKAASWIRIADAARPMGAGLRNSVGHPFQLTKNELGLVLKSPYGDIPVPPSQYAVGYGQAAIENFVFEKSATNELQLLFKLRLTGKNHERILKELSDFDPIRNPSHASTRDPHALAIVQMIQSVVNDFPPELLQRVKFQIR